MKRIFVLGLLLLVSAAGCAGLPRQYNQNVAKNAGIGTALGAATGAAIGLASETPVGKAALIGAAIGGWAFGLNTPVEEEEIITPDNPGVYGAYWRGYGDRLREIQREKERSAYEAGYGSKYRYSKYRYRRYHRYHRYRRYHRY